MITLRLSVEERRRFDFVAKDMGLDISGMLRTLVREKEKKIAPLRFVKPGPIKASR